MKGALPGTNFWLVLCGLLIMEFLAATRDNMTHKYPTEFTRKSCWEGRITREIHYTMHILFGKLNVSWITSEQPLCRSGVREFRRMFLQSVVKLGVAFVTFAM